MADERYITEDPELDDGQTADEDGEGAGLYEHFAVVADKGQALLRHGQVPDRTAWRSASRNRIQAAADSRQHPRERQGRPSRATRSNRSTGFQIVMPYPRFAKSKSFPKTFRSTYRYEDDDLLIVNKAAGTGRASRVTATIQRHARSTR